MMNDRVADLDIFFSDRRIRILALRTDQIGNQTKIHQSGHSLKAMRVSLRKRRPVSSTGSAKIILKNHSVYILKFSDGDFHLDIISHQLHSKCRVFL
jgi:hypothetical protein